MLKSRGYYSIQVEGKQIELLFNTWAFKRFSELCGGLTYMEMLNKISASLSIEEFTILLKASRESFCLKNKISETVSEYDVTEWMDAIGGISGEGVVKIVEHLVSVITNADIKPLATTTEDVADTKSNVGHDSVTVSASMQEY